MREKKNQQNQQNKHNKQNQQNQQNKQNQQSQQNKHVTCFINQVRPSHDGPGSDQYHQDRGPVPPGRFWEELSDTMTPLCSGFIKQQILILRPDGVQRNESGLQRKAVLLRQDFLLERNLQEPSWTITPGISHRFWRNIEPRSSSR